jgi:hypothetical protein
MESWKATQILMSTQAVFMSVLVNDIAKDGIGTQPDKGQLKQLYDFLFKTIEIFNEIQEEKAHELKIGDALANNRIRHTEEN